MTALSALRLQNAWRAQPRSSQAAKLGQRLSCHGLLVEATQIWTPDPQQPCLELPPDSPLTPSRA